MANGIFLKVDPGALANTAQGIQQLIVALRRDFSTMQGLMAKTESYWVGTAGDRKRREFALQKANVDEILARISKFPQNLFEISNTYAAAETKIQNKAGALPSNFLE